MQVTIERDWQALYRHWERLHGAARLATPFMSPGWAAAWFTAWDPNVEPFLLVARLEGHVIGLAPLVRRRKGPLRTLEPVGMEPGDYWDVLAAPGDAEAVCAAFAATLLREKGRWDAWILRCPPPESPIVDALADFPALVRPPLPAPNIDLPGDFETYLANLSGSHRSNLRKHLRRLDGGEVTLEEIRDGDRLAEFVERWQRFRRAQWEAQGKDIDLDHLSPRFAAFMHAVLREMVPWGAALAWEFSVDGAVVGSYVNFVDADAFHWYLGGFDPAVAKLGLGKIAIGHGIRTSIEAGRKRFDFGRGAEPYKYWYGAIDRELAARVVGSPTLRGKAALKAADAVIQRRVSG